MTGHRLHDNDHERDRRTGWPAAGQEPPPDLFTHAPPGTGTGAAPAAASPAETVDLVETVDKPWGHEEVFGVLEGRYVGKVLHIRAGYALSLQHHVLKDETLSVRSGQVTVEHGPGPGLLETSVLGPGQRLLVRAGTVHRLRAVVDSEVLEVSTAWPGWRTDVVRLDDGYGRTGTSAP